MRTVSVAFPVPTSQMLQFPTAPRRNWTGAFSSIILGAIILLCLRAVSGQAATYYIATNGVDSNAGTSTNLAWAQLSKAAATMVPGDVLYICGGRYNCSNYASQYFVPHKGGLTISNYPGQVPVFANLTGSQPLLDFRQNGSQTNVIISGLVITNCNMTAWFYSVTNFELKNCDISLGSPCGYTTNGNGYCLVVFAYSSVSNWIHGNTIHDFNDDFTFSAPTQHDAGTILEMGVAPDSIGENGDYSGWNLIENNHFYHGGHDTLLIQCPHNIIRNNFFHNEAWIQWPDWHTWGGHRTMEIEAGAIGNIVELNRFAYAALPVDNDGADGLTIDSSNNIIRFNVILWAQDNGVQFYTKGSPWDSVNNHFYNNVLAFNSISSTWYQTNYSMAAPNNWAYYDKYTMRFINSSNNVIMNTIFYCNGGVNTTTPPRGGTVITNRITGEGPGDMVLNCWTNSAPGMGDPLFVNVIATNITMLDGQVVNGNPFDDTTYNFHLQSNSPCIDTGKFLTQITSSNGSGTTFTVADPYFFYNGYGMTTGDKIQFLGQTNTAHVTTVNYSNGSITVDASMSWTNKQWVSTAYSGIAPDIGAYEYVGSVSSTNLTLTAPIGMIGMAWAATAYPSLEVQVSGSVNWANSLHYDFGDGNYTDFGSTNAASTSHTYASPGTYTVTLTASNYVSGRSISGSRAITVTQ